MYLRANKTIALHNIKQKILINITREN